MIVKAFLTLSSHSVGYISSAGIIIHVSKLDEEAKVWFRAVTELILGPRAGPR